MIHISPHPCSLCSLSPRIIPQSFNKTWCSKPRVSNSGNGNDSAESDKSTNESLCRSRFCLCGRRHLMQIAGTSLLPISPSNASDLHSDDPIAMLNKIHPPRPEWYEEFYASVLNLAMKPYEDEIAGYKVQLFANLTGKVEDILEIGIGTGPNLKYYASNNGVNVFCIDPNKKMEKYAQAAAVAVGLRPTNFKFIPAVAEALPLSDASVDAVIGTLVLCSVENVDMALQEVRRVLKPGGLYIFVEHVAAKDGTFRRFVQGVLNPLQQTLSDGCHLTRNTGKNICEAGFSNVDLNLAFLSTASLINPHVYGIARK